MIRSVKFYACRPILRALENPRDTKNALKKTGGANGEAAGGTQLRGMHHIDSHFCFGRRPRHQSPILVACTLFAIHLL
jgi:hypothetical protein